MIMDNHKVAKGPPTVYYIPDFINNDEEKEIINKVNSVPLPKWTQLSNRRLQNWGGLPHPKGMIAEELPQWLQRYVNRVENLDIFDEQHKPNHVLINEYKPGQGIMPHFDGPLFYPTITTISCGSHALLEFCKKQDSDSQTESSQARSTKSKKGFSILVEPRSLLVLKDLMYHDFQHSIAEVHADGITDSIINLNETGKQYTVGDLIQRSTRYSLTIRHVPKTTKLKIKLGR